MKWMLWSVLAIGLLACGDDDGGTTVDAGGDNDSGTNDANVPSADAGDSAVGCGPLTGRNAECTTCLTTNCCTELAACGSDVHCGGLIECLRGCDEDASSTCMTECVGVHGVPMTYNPLLLCGAGDCAAECPFTSP